MSFFASTESLTTDDRIKVGRFRGPSRRTQFGLVVVVMLSQRIVDPLAPRVYPSLQKSSNKKTNC